MKIITEKIVYSGTLVVEEGTIVTGSHMIKRQRVNRQDAVAVLVFNKETQKVILTRQFRYAISKTSNQNILEIVAGKIDGDDSALATAVRETEEEIGYKVDPGALIFLTTCYPSPGYTAERFHIFFAEVTNASKVSDGGGLEEENEYIEIVEMPVQDFVKSIETGELVDAKTYVAALLAIRKAYLVK